METIIAKRSPAGLIFLVGAATGFEIIIYGIIERLFLMVVFGMLLTVVFLPHTIHFARLPANVILLSERNTVLLPEKKKFRCFLLKMCPINERNEST